MVATDLRPLHFWCSKGQSAEEPLGKFLAIMLMSTPWKLSLPGENILHHSYSMFKLALATTHPNQTVSWTSDPNPCRIVLFGSTWIHTTTVKSITYIYIYSYVYSSYQSHTLYHFTYDTHSIKRGIKWTYQNSNFSNILATYLSEFQQNSPICAMHLLDLLLH